MNESKGNLEWPSPAVLHMKALDRVNMDAATRRFQLIAGELVSNDQRNNFTHTGSCANTSKAED